jgi:hypothetical protein
VPSIFSLAEGGAPLDFCSASDAVEGSIQWFMDEDAEPQPCFLSLGFHSRFFTGFNMGDFSSSDSWLTAVAEVLSIFSEEIPSTFTGAEVFFTSTGAEVFWLLKEFSEGRCSNLSNCGQPSLAVRLSMRISSAFCGKENSDGIN